MPTEAMGSTASRTPAPTDQNIRTPNQWASAFLYGIGAARTPTNIEEVVAWEKVEGGNWHNTAHFNPLNTSMKEPTSVNYQTQQPGGGVQSYGSWGTGLAATIATLEGTEPYYKTILNDLLNSAPPATFAHALGESPWDAGHYQENGGAPGSSIAAAMGVPYNPTSSGPSARSAGTAGTTPNQVPKETGLAAILQGLDRFLNPGSGGGILSFINVPKDVEDVLLLVVDRGIMSVFFLIVIVGGVWFMVHKDIGGILGGVTKVTRLHQAADRIRLATSVEGRRTQESESRIQNRNIRSTVAVASEQRQREMAEERARTNAARQAANERAQAEREATNKRRDEERARSNKAKEEAAAIHEANKQKQTKASAAERALTREQRRRDKAEDRKIRKAESESRNKSRAARDILAQEAEKRKQTAEARRALAEMKKGK